jgi:hypothetical protein
MRARKLDTLIWMVVMRRMAQDFYAAELAAVNMPATLLNDIEVLEESFASKAVEQEFFKSIILRQTRLRIEKLNHLHSFIVNVQRAAQSVFVNDKERRELFNLN